MRTGVVMLTVGLGLLGGCIGATDSSGSGGGARPSAAQRRFPLDTLPTSKVSIGQHTFRVWLALDQDRQTEGLMFVPPDELADDQGMLFVFPFEAERFFWMRNTVTALDIAYARADGTIVKIWTMPPLTLQNFPSGEPALLALEVKAGTFGRLGIQVGDKIEVPAEVFKAAP